METALCTSLNEAYLHNKLTAARRWCRNAGPLAVSELLDSYDDLAKYLGLKLLEGRRLLKALAAARSTGQKRSRSRGSSPRASRIRCATSHQDASAPATVVAAEAPATPRAAPPAEAEDMPRAAPPAEAEDTPCAAPLAEAEDMSPARSCPKKGGRSKNTDGV